MCFSSWSSPRLPEIPIKDCPPEGRGKLLRCVCTLRRLTANEPRLGQAAQTQPSCSRRREATPDSRGLARTRHWGERDTSTLAGGKRGNGKGARPTMAFKEGAAILTWPELGHPPVTSVSRGAWTCVIPRPPPASRLNHLVSRTGSQRRQDQSFLSVYFPSSVYLMNLPSAGSAQRGEDRVVRGKRGVCSWAARRRAGHRLCPPTRSMDTQA